MQTTHGCGDLVFSSHTIFALAGMMTYNEYGTHLATKVCCFGLRISCSVLLCSSAHGMCFPTSSLAVNFQPMAMTAGAMCMSLQPG